jgi:molecular chaperone DnaK (HSP70)
MDLFKLQEKQIIEIKNFKTVKDNKQVASLFEYTLTNEIFDQLIERGWAEETNKGSEDFIEKPSLYKACFKVLDECFSPESETKVPIESISKCVLVGGATRMTPIITKLKDYFKDCKIEINNEFDPEESVARGAAIQGGLIAGQIGSLNFKNILSQTIGIKQKNG